MSRVKSSTAQLARLSEHMRTHPNMASGVANSLQGRADLERQWMNLTDILNSLGGPIKTVAKWKQAWRDLRNNVKKKAAHNHQVYRGYGLGGTGDGPHSYNQLSKVDEQVFRMDGVEETMPTPGPTQIMVVPAAESRVYNVSSEPPNSVSPVHSQTKQSVTPTQVYHIGGPSPAQTEKLLELLEKRRYLATGHDHTTNARSRARNAWIEISRILNNIGDGCIKDWRQWAKYWKVMKGATKRKALTEAARQKADEGVNTEDLELSELEQRILTVAYGSHSATEDRRPAIDLFPEEESASSESVSPSESSVLQVKSGLSECHTVMIVEEGLSQWDENAAAFVGAEGTVREVLDSLPAASLNTTPTNNHVGASIKDETMSSSEDDRGPGEITENEGPPAVGSRDRLGGAQARRIPVTAPIQRRRTAPPPQRTKSFAQQGRSLRASPRPSKARGGVSEAARRRLSQRSSETASLTERLVAIEERRVDAEHAIARSQEMFAQGHLKMAEALNKLSNTLGIFAQQLFDNQQDRRSSYNGG